MLWLHIAGGTSSLINGLGAMFTKKGSNIHRLFGKIYFWSMTAVFVSAVTLAIGHHKTFLLMVAFFSYYFTVRGYRILYLKNLGTTQKPACIDKWISFIAGAFILFLYIWGFAALLHQETMGIVAVVFAIIGTTFLVKDIQQFRSRTAPEKMHWWYGHISSMGASYIAASTAFVVVNISIPGFGWALWILPSVIGGTLIGRTIRSYKKKFATA